MKGKHRRKAAVRDAQRTAEELAALQARYADEQVKVAALASDLAEMQGLADEVADLASQVEAATAERVSTLGEELSDLSELIHMAEQELRRWESDPVWSRHDAANAKTLPADRLEHLADAVGRPLPEGTIVLVGVHEGAARKRMTPEQIKTLQRVRGVRR